MSAHSINAAGAAVKLRRPWAAALLSLVPVYWFVWYYRVNREMRDCGRAHGDEQLAATKPWLSVLATTLGWFLVVPPLVSLWKTVRRIGRCERLAGARPGSANALIAVLVGAWALHLAAGLVVNASVAGGIAVAAMVLWVAGTAGAQARLTALWTRYAPATPEPGDHAHAAVAT